jgi:glutathione S-transferase
MIAGVFPGIPRVLPDLARRGLLKQMHVAGIGRHTPAEIYAMGNADLDALGAFLGGKPFLLGERVTSLDAVAYGFLAQLFFTPEKSPLCLHARGMDNLRRYAETIRATYDTAEGES